MTQDSLRLQKAALRKTMRAALKEISSEERARQSTLACERLCSLPEFQAAGLILAYMAMAHECSPAPAVAQAQRLGKRVAFPLCGADYALRLLVPKEPDAFYRGAYGILEPMPEKCEEVGPQELDFIILPGLAFDPACNRLGQGAGYYDRLLPQTRAFLAGLCLDSQLVEAVPTGGLDVPLHAVAAPGGLYRRPC